MIKLKKIYFFLCIILLGFFLFAYKHRVGIWRRIKKSPYIPEWYCTGNNTLSKQTYEQAFNTSKRYLAIGFDDFRESDFEMVLPLFNKYGAKATFNRIAWDDKLSSVDLCKIYRILKSGCELGDHTWFHCNYIYTDAMFNGQNPACVEGNQTPFPSNDQMRLDCGNGKNVFGFDVKAQPVLFFTFDGEKFNSSWENLTDEDCQRIRDGFSIYKDTSGKLKILDTLSNKYLGTTGVSFGSFDKQKDCYTGGIFTGAKTSCNHEIWERIIQITKLFYKDLYNADFEFKTWSWPGDPHSPFKFTKDGKFYYDEDCTVLFNYLADFPSSIYKVNGLAKTRSWTDILRENGYVITHDTIFPSRKDGVLTVMMSYQLIYNAFLSRKDALPYRTNGSVSYTKIAEEYNKDCFSGDKSVAAQMYDKKRIFVGCRKHPAES